MESTQDTTSRGRSEPHALTAIVIAIVFLLAPAGNAPAQDAHETAIAAGVSWKRVEGDYGRWFTYPGWSAEVDRSLSAHISVVAEGSGNIYSIDYSNEWSESHRFYAVFAGPMFIARVTPAVRGFARLLAGVEQTRVTLHAPPELDFEGSSSGFAIEIGGGTDIRLARHEAVRGYADVTVAAPFHSFSWHVPQWRFGINGVYRWVDALSKRDAPRPAAMCKRE